MSTVYDFTVKDRKGNDIWYNRDIRKSIADSVLDGVYECRQELFFSGNNVF